MAAGIRVTVEFTAPAGCPIADLAATADTAVKEISTSVSPAGETGAVSEFLVAADAVPDDYDRDPVFTYTDRHCYRVEHGTAADCPCACLGEHDTPVDRFFADGDALRLVFHAPDFETLQTVVGDLRDRYSGVDIQRLVRAPTEGAPRDTVFVDRGKLTDRQREILRAAYERGYFERPRRTNATELAADFDITPSTLTEHLAAAQRKLVGDVLEADQ